jgi:hypothetical protein
LGLIHATKFRPLKYNLQQNKSNAIVSVCNLQSLMYVC